jgi:hypothetical protein
MIHNYSDLTVQENTAIPVDISIYRGEDYDSYQEALEQGATYSVNSLTDIIDINVTHFELAGAMTVANMFGHTSMVFAVHDDAQLFFEEESSEITAEYLESYRLGLLAHMKGTNVNTVTKTVIGWNYENGLGVNVPMKFPIGMTGKEMYNEAANHFRNIAEDRCGNGDNLWAVSITDEAPTYTVDAHFCGTEYDEYGFNKPPKKIFSYSLSTNTIWFGGDSGTIEAHSYEEAKSLAQKEIEQHLVEINKRLEGLDTIEVSIDSIEIEEAK